MGFSQANGLTFDFVPVAAQPDKPVMCERIGKHMGRDAGQMQAKGLVFMAEGVLENHCRRFAFGALEAGHPAVKRQCRAPIARQKMKRYPDLPLVSQNGIFIIHGYMGSDNRVNSLFIGQDVNFAVERIVYKLRGIGNGIGRIRFNSCCAGQGIDTVKMHIQLHGFLLSFEIKELRFNSCCAGQGIDTVKMHIQLHGLLLSFEIKELIIDLPGLLPGKSFKLIRNGSNYDKMCERPI